MRFYVRLGGPWFPLVVRGLALVAVFAAQHARQTARKRRKDPKLAGAYRLSSVKGTALVGYHGSFWVGVGTVDPVRIQVIADDVPAALGFSAATSLLDFGPTPIGDRTYLLPQGAEIVFTDTWGNRHQSRLSFSGWHAFVGESVVRFNVPSSGPAVALPKEFKVDVDLLSGIDSATAAGGDPIQATLRDNIKVNREIVVPIGATLSGRIAHITKNGASYIPADAPRELFGKYRALHEHRKQLLDETETILRRVQKVAKGR